MATRCTPPAATAPRPSRRCSRNADVNQAAYDGTTPLAAACGGNGRVEAVATLLAQNADVNQAAYDGTTPLYAACGGNGRAEVVATLLTQNADVNQAAYDGTTPLYAACGGNAAEVVTTLLIQNADVNQPPTMAPPAVRRRGGNGRAEVVTTLLAQNADVNRRQRWHHAAVRRLRAATSASSAPVLRCQSNFHRHRRQSSRSAIRHRGAPRHRTGPPRHRRLARYEPPLVAAPLPGVHPTERALELLRDGVIMMRGTRRPDAADRVKELCNSGAADAGSAARRPRVGRAEAGDARVLLTGGAHLRVALMWIAQSIKRGKASYEVRFEARTGLRRRSPTSSKLRDSASSPRRRGANVGYLARCRRQEDRARARVAGRYCIPSGRAVRGEPVISVFCAREAPSGSSGDRAYAGLTLARMGCRGPRRAAWQRRRVDGAPRMEGGQGGRRGWGLDSRGLYKKSPDADCDTPDSISRARRRADHGAALPLCPSARPPRSPHAPPHTPPHARCTRWPMLRTRVHCVHHCVHTPSATPLPAAACLAPARRAHRWAVNCSAEATRSQTSRPSRLSRQRTPTHSDTSAS